MLLSDGIPLLDIPEGTLTPTHKQTHFGSMESIFGTTSTSGAQQPQTQQQSYSQRGPSGYGTSASVPSLQQVQYQVEKARNWIQNYLQNVTENLRYYVNQYPPLAAFLFTLLILSAVPVSIFVVIGLVTSVFFLSVALIGFSAIEGTILLTSGGILLAVLSGIAIFTTCAFGFLGLCYMGYKGTCAACTQVWQGASQLQSKVQEQAGPSLSQFMQPPPSQSGQPQASYQSNPSSAMPTRT